MYAQHFSGMGLVVDAQAGLVAVDRNTVPITLGDARLVFFESLEVPARVVFVHPLHNVALLSYDTGQLGEVKLEPPRLVAGDLRDQNHTFAAIGFKPNGLLWQQAIDNVTIQTLDFDLPRLPRYQQSSIDVFSIPGMPRMVGGVISDEMGSIYSLWSSFAYPGRESTTEGEWALPAEVIIESLQLYQNSEQLHLMGASLSYVSMVRARQLGLSDDWLQRIASQGEESFAGRRVLVVRQISSHTLTSGEALAADSLQVGDLLLAINDQPVIDLRDVEKRIQMARVRITLLRNGQVQTVALDTRAVDTFGTRRLVNWAGAYLQQPHREIAVQRGLSARGVYVSATMPGSPANRDGLYRNRLITAVDGKPVVDLNDFLGYVAGKAPDEDTRLTLVSLNGSRDLVSVRPRIISGLPLSWLITAMIGNALLTKNK